jgi:6-phosphogluconolactonase/glucosamine-6-phosphate isomerase/deaminase
LKPEINTYNNYEALSMAVASLIFSRLKLNESFLLGMATGYSPRKIYAQLGLLLKQDSSQVSKILGFQIDEWMGVAPDEPSSCNYFIQQHIIKPWGIQNSQVFQLNGKDPNPSEQLSGMKQFLLTWIGKKRSSCP